jgi:sirohydrochlorin ferrochelatase
MKAVLLISHGSRLSKTKDEIVRLIFSLRPKTNIPIFEYAFLEIESPSIPEGIDLCVEKGATEIIVLLNFLNAGRHVDKDIPRIINESRKKYSNVKIRMSRPVGQHEGMEDLFIDLID